MTAEFYLQTVEEVFQKHSIPKGEFRHKGELVDLTRSPTPRCWRSKASAMTFPASARPGALKLTPNLPEDEEALLHGRRRGPLRHLQRLKRKPRAAS
jgi:poly(3-hydroxybutyrate) depolymerase